jgi:predicted DNA-binding transcriptional regulator AlpA
MTANQTTAPPVTPIPMPTPALLTRQETAQLINVSLVSLKRWNRSGRFGPSPIKLGKCTRFRRDEVLAWVAAGCPARREWRWNGGGK